jgi:amino acid permease
LGSAFLSKFIEILIFQIFFVFPVSTPRDLSTLRFTSAFSVMMSFYIVLVIVFECLLNHGTSPSISEGFKAAHHEKQLSSTAIFNCLPLIIFSFMYQINIPAIYSELSDKSITNMNRVLSFGTLGASLLYILAGVFGFAAFAAVGPEGYPYDKSVNPPI